MLFCHTWTIFIAEITIIQIQPFFYYKYLTSAVFFTIFGTKSNKPDESYNKSPLNSPVVKKKNAFSLFIDIYLYVFN